MNAYKRPKKDIPRIEGSHEQNWIDGITGKTKLHVELRLLGPFTETVLPRQRGQMFAGRSCCGTATR